MNARSAQRRAEFLSRTGRASVEPVEPTRHDWSYSKPASVRKIIERAAAECGITARMLMEPSQEAARVRARVRAMWQMRCLGFSLPMIGRFLGGMHHTTVQHHLKKLMLYGLDAKPPVRMNPAAVLVEVDSNAPDESGIWV